MPAPKGRGKASKAKQAATRAKLKKTPAKAPPPPPRSFREDVDEVEARERVALEKGGSAEVSKRASGRVTMSVNGGEEVDLGGSVSEARTNLSRAARGLRQKNLLGGIVEPPELEDEVTTTTRVKLKAQWFKATLTSEAAIKLLSASRDERIYAVGKAMSVKNQKVMFIPEGAYEEDREKLLGGFLHKGERFRDLALNPGRRP